MTGIIKISYSICTFIFRLTVYDEVFLLSLNIFFLSQSFFLSQIVLLSLLNTLEACLLL